MGNAKSQPPPSLPSPPTTSPHHVDWHALSSADDESTQPAPAPRNQHTPTRLHIDEVDGISFDDEFKQAVDSAIADESASSPESLSLSLQPTQSNGLAASSGRRRRLEDFYMVESKPLGRGHYATVWKARSRATLEAVAVKKIKRALTDEARLQAEVAALRRIRTHPNIVTLLDVFETHSDVQLVMELCTGGELFERLASRGPYSEMDCVRHVKHLAQAVAYMHAHNIVHRDLKPENILLSTADDAAACIKIADFGLAKLNTTTMKTKCGTWGYSGTQAAPEMISGSGVSFGYDAKVDSWSIGTILYILLCGFHPFDPLGNRSDNDMIAAIKKCHFDFTDDAWIGISAQAKDLIRHLLVLDPTLRYSMAELLAHPWIVGQAGVDIPVQPLSPTIHTDLARFQQQSKQKMLSYEEE
ncbi:Aste57867_4750 [Aphanomyces stellatus]|uniref:Aste57867_4750 protein n=1 Tax=Aphanomyces stellatus TaxID=120398 RepID=A0A485KEE3_9STRA|nr:hypothetical protein As57867_004737 [Aphanomyces stellatus]VFT81846.1 Aste57867_4750 [Aphanomyces stellatus]